MKERKYTVCGVGSALVDIQAHVTDDELTKLGLAKGGMSLTDENGQKSALAQVKDQTTELHAGGSAANTIVAMAQLGAPVAFGCSVGDDVYGQTYVQQMKDVGVTVDSQPKSAVSGTCLVLITPDAERTMHTNLAVSANIQPSDIGDDVIANSEWVYLEGYLYTGPDGQQTAASVIERAKAANTKIALSLSDAFVVDTQRELITAAMRDSVDLVFCNRAEATAYTGEEDIQRAAAGLATTCDYVIVTDSANGSYVKLGRDAELEHVAAIPTQPQDMTGAGDAYAAGLLYGLTHRLTTQQAGWLGATIASQCVAQMGARLPNSIDSHLDNIPA